MNTVSVMILCSAGDWMFLNVSPHHALVQFQAAAEFDPLILNLIHSPGVILIILNILYLFFIHNTNNKC